MKKKKRILIFIDWFTPGYKAGGPVSSIVNLVTGLSDKYDFYILTSDCEYLETEPYKNIVSNKWLNFDENIRVFYASRAEMSVKLIKSAVFSVDFDIAYINGIYSFYFSILPLYLLRNSGKKMIVAARGMLSSQAFTSKNIKKKLFLSFVKYSGLYKNCIFQATNYDEAREIKNLNLRMREIVVLPNLTKKIENIKSNSSIKKPGELSLVSIARISKEKNTKFALEILANNQYKGKIKFDIYGSIYDHDYWNECVQIIDTLPENINVNYCNTIESFKVSEMFSKYNFSFMPSAGENFGHSILESMMTGTPVIISKNTPWQNLINSNSGWDIDLNDKNSFYRTIQYCIDMGADEHSEMTSSTKAFALSHIEKSDTLEKTVSLFG